MTDYREEVLRLLGAVRSLREENERLRASGTETIAIVGMSARLPFEGVKFGLWEGLREGVDASKEVPSDRWDANAYYDPDPHARGKAVTKRASLLADVHGFDARFFGIAPVEAQAMDPQQRLVLETTWEALADAGVTLEMARAQRTGVFLGVCQADYAQLVSVEGLPEALTPYAGTGASSSVVAGRVSYALGLTGVSFVVDTACSSSLVALHLACESLRVRTTDLAVTGGVNLILSPRTTVMLSKLGALSPDGRCRTFDAKGSGYGRGEGCGVVVLKRLSDAVRDGDRIRAVIRGSAVNQDGASDGLTAPSGMAQQQVIRAALEASKLTPADVQYVEAHGTGTVLGDPIEIEALAEVYGAEHAKGAPLAIGSVKSNIGHLEGAAGVSGLIKTVLAIEHREIPPSLHFKTPNPHVDWERIPLEVQTKLGPWPAPDKPLVAGVSSFGFSGTNAHVLVSEPPAEAPGAWEQADRLAEQATSLSLCLSAKTPEALRTYAARFAEHLGQGLGGRATWRDVAYTASVRQTHLEHRLVVVGSSAEAWREKLAAFARGESPRATATGEATKPHERAVFVFSGQGTQWWGMGRELAEREAVFRDTLAECAAHIGQHADWSLLEELGRDEATSRLRRTDIAQPALVALQMALVRLLASWGVEPSAVVGHSIGEIAAACTAGVLTLEQACHVATVRGRVMHEASGRGKMAAVRVSVEKAEAVARDFPGELVVGAYNAPESVVLSGEPAAVDKALAMLSAQGVETKELRVDYAFHSPQMDPFVAKLAAALQGLEPSSPKVAIISTVTGGADGTYDAAYWSRQMREPVRFARAIETLLGRDHALFVEVGPHPALLASIDETASARGKRTKVVPTLRRDGDQAELAREAVAAMHCAGYPVKWRKAFAVAGRVVSLPSYPWQRERYWAPQAKKTTGRTSNSPWALIGLHVPTSEQGGKHVFEVELDLEGDAHRYLGDHKVQGGVWLPGAAYAEMALEAGRMALGGEPVAVQELTLSQSLVLVEGEAVLVQLLVQPEQDGGRDFRIASRPSKETSGAWTPHASGRLVVDGERAAEPARGALEQAQKRCVSEVGAAELYEGFDAAGLSYGPAFQGIERAWSGDGEALSRLVPLEKLTDQVSGYVVHPSLLDAAFQTTAVLMRESGRTYVPATMGHVRVVGAGVARWAHAKVRLSSEDAVECDLRLFDEQGRVVVSVERLRLQALGKATDHLDEWLFDMAWRTVPAATREAVGGRWLLLVDEQGVGTSLGKWLASRGVEVVAARRGDAFRKESDSTYEVDVRSRESLARLMKDAFGKTPPSRVVHLWSLDARTAAGTPLDDAALGRAEQLTCTSSLHLLQTVEEMAWSEAPRVFFVTSASQPASGSRDVLHPEQALTWGFVATAAHEMSELALTLVDIEASTAVDVLGAELASADDENRVALRGTDRRVPRLVRHTRGTKPAGALRSLTVGAQGYALDPLEPSRLDSLMLRPAVIPSAGRGEVVIRTHASGVNFRDVLMTMGMYPGLGEGRLPMGSEFAGVVHAVGDGVQTLQPGDEVVGTGAHGFDAYAVTREELVVKKPSTLSFAQAAALPSVVMTVLYALQHVARLAKGERVLIHAATGGVGLAAVQYAKHVGAEIFATAGSEEKRAYLRTQGIAHVYDSRTLAWADEVKRDTGGRGVDVVLNSLAGEAIAKGVSVLRPFGRFLEIGKRDIYENTALGLYAMRHNITLSAVALDELASERPREARALLEETFRLVADGTLSPLPVETYPVSRAVEAFEQLARARHIGKVVVTSEETVTVRDAARSDDVQPGKTYLVTGGLGGLGLVVARRLAKLGATHLALMSRSAPSESARSAIAELEQSGVRVHVVRGDVANRASLDAALAELSQTAPPLVGLVHAAGVLDDATVATLSAARIGPVLAPKVTGAVALEAALPDLALRVYFASVAGVLGSGGQAPYAAANAFLDAFAHHLAGQSRRALSLDWGAWADVGLAARGDRVDNVTRQGLAMISPDDGAELFERLLASSSVQVAPIPIDFRQWRQANPTLAGMPLLRELMASAKRGAQKKTDLFDRIQGAASAAERGTVIEDYLRDVVATILRSSPDAVGRAAPFKQLGFDSLMSVSLKNTLERDLAIPLSTATLFAHASVERLAAFLAGKLVPADRVDESAAAAHAGDAAISRADNVSTEDPSLEELRRLVYG